MGSKVIDLCISEIFPSPNCRICQTEKEESSHLFAFCPGLTQIRMRILGTTQLQENFEWKPQQLLEMIKEIDKICPEEGMLNFDDTNQNTSYDPQAPNTHISE
jgi:hypothetical protein